MLKEFQEFALKGNVVDMAVGIIIGGAFGTIVKSLVADVIMPPIGLLVGGIDFASLVITLREASEGVEAVTINYGVFLNNVFAFLIVAWALFMVIKSMNAMRKKEEEAPKEPEAPPKQEVLLEEIRDIMQKQAN